MKNPLILLLKNNAFKETRDLNTVPDTKGLYIITDRPLTKTDPSEWSCKPLAKGFADNLRSKIIDVVLSNNFPLKYKDLTYSFATGLSPKEYQCFQEQISQVRFSDK